MKCEITFTAFREEVVDVHENCYFDADQNSRFSKARPVDSKIAVVLNEK